MFKRNFREIIILSLIVIAGIAGGILILGGFDSEETKKYKEARKKLLAQPTINTEKAIIGEFTYDECYYVYIRTQNKDFIIHKGNCPNPHHHCLIDRNLNPPDIPNVPPFTESKL